MAEYDSAVALALRLITKKGRVVTLRRRTAAAAPDPSKPWRPGAASNSDQTVSAVSLDTGGQGRKGGTGFAVISGDPTLVTETARAYLVAASGLSTVPAAGDLVVDGSAERSIALVSEVRPGGQAVLYELVVRG